MVEIVLHIFRNQRYSREANGAIAPAARHDLKLVLLMDLLQLPLSLVFTRFMNLFSTLLPAPSDNMLSRLLVLAAGIILTGIGAAMSLNMRIIPIRETGSYRLSPTVLENLVGFTKNCFDLFNIWPYYFHWPDLRSQADRYRPWNCNRRTWRRTRDRSI